MAYFTLDEFIRDYCSNNYIILRERRHILLQAIGEKRLISRYDKLLHTNIDKVDTWLRDFADQPGWSDEVDYDAEIVITQMLILLLADMPSLEWYPLPIYGEYVTIEPLPLIIHISPTANIYSKYYDNLYHVLLVWIIYESSLLEEHLYSFYYDMLVMEDSHIYRMNISMDMNLLVNYAENNYYSTQGIESITSEVMSELASKYQLRRRLFIERDFSNFHSHVLYVRYLYNERTMPRDYIYNILHYPYANNIINWTWNIRSNIYPARKYRVIKTSSDLYEDIIRAQAQEINSNGNVLTLLHVAQYGLNLDNKLLKILLHVYVYLTMEYKRILLSAILMKMGYPLDVIFSYTLGHLLAIVLTGVIVKWTLSNIVYTNSVIHETPYDLYFPANMGTNNIDIYAHLYEHDFVSIETLIERFNIPTYGRIDIGDENPTLYKYVDPISVIVSSLGQFPPFNDMQLMQSYYPGEECGIVLKYQPALSYWECTLSVQQLAAKYDIANVYLYNNLLMILKAQQDKSPLIYYRKSSYELGDGKLMRADEQEITVGPSDYYITQPLLDDHTGINFISLAHALNLFATPGRQPYSDEDGNVFHISTTIEPTET